MHRNVALLLLVTATAAGLLLVASVGFSAALPGHRIWPLKGGIGDWRFWTVWGQISLFTIASVGLGLSSFDTLGLPHVSSTVAGAFVFFGGNLLAWWGAGRIGATATLGMKDRLVTAGPYRWTRNPQYLGDVLVLVGCGYETRSTLATLAILQRH